MPVQNPPHQEKPADYLINENLEAVAEMSNYRRWIFETVSPFLGPDILEAGCGNGNLASFLLKNPVVRRYVGIEKEPDLCAQIQKVLLPHPQQEIQIKNFDLESPEVLALRAQPFDAVVCLNVLEHLKDDAMVIQRFYEILKPGGNLILFVPAHPWLYGTIDKVIHHFRRYSKQDLSEKLISCGFKITQIHHFNPLGILGWVWHGKIRKVLVHPKDDLRRWDRWVPVLRILDKIWPLPLGLSLFAVTRKN